MKKKSDSRLLTGPVSNGVIEIIPTNTCPPDLAELSRRSELFSSFAPFTQLDVGDGKFVPEASWPYRKGQEADVQKMLEGSLSLPLCDRLFYEIHLMVEEPLEIGKALARAGAKRIIGHIEGFADKREALYALESWKHIDTLEAGFALLLDTPIPVILPVMGECDVVQLMSIASLGYQGAKFEERVILRIEELHAQYPDLAIEVDGGVSEKNIAQLVRAGARRFGVGSAISKADNPRAAYENLKALAESAL